MTPSIYLFCQNTKVAETHAAFWGLKHGEFRVLTHHHALLGLDEGIFVVFPRVTMRNLELTNKLYFHSAIERLQVLKSRPRVSVVALQPATLENSDRCRELLQDAIRSLSK